MYIFYERSIVFARYGVGHYDITAGIIETEGFFNQCVLDTHNIPILYHSTARIIAHFISPDIIVIMIVYAHIPEECVSVQPHRLSGKMKDESKLQHRKNGCKQPQ